MKSVKSFRRKFLVLFMLVAVIASSIPLGSTYATSTDELPESDSLYHVEIIPSEDNSYMGEGQANFTVKVDYSGTDVVQKETVYLETVISDAVTSSCNEDVLSTKRLNPSELTGDFDWEESYSINIPKQDADTDVDYMVMLKDGEDNVLASANYQFKIESPKDALEVESDADVEANVSLQSEEVPATNALRSYTEITGTLPNKITGLDKLYYGSVAKDNTAPFHNAEELQEILETKDEAYAREVWRKYRYDLYDPNFSKRGGASGALLTPSGEKYKKDDKKPSSTNPNDKPDYADELLESTGHEYPKDEVGGPFHNNASPQIDSAEGTLVNGALVENDESAFKDLAKKASPDEGDDNKERKYAVDLEATADLKQTKPMAMVFQIQTSWQMFDLLHANSRESLVDKNAVTADLLSLYEMKQGFLDFIEWQKEYAKGSLMIAITNFQHADKSYSMFGTPYFSNDCEKLVDGLYGWDSFGDCEHIHYDSEQLDNAITALGEDTNFSAWKDSENNSIYKNAEKISVIIGGGCEERDLKKSTTSLPKVDENDKKRTITRQYGIRTNTATSYGKNSLNDKISWMDLENEKNAFKTGEYYKDVVTREKFFETLKAIYMDAQDKAENMQRVTNVALEDTVTAEFEVKKSEIKAYVGGKDVTNNTNLKVEVQEDGTTKVSYNFGTVEHGEKVRLTIPVQAKDDFIGSNNVYTNVGTPTISYTGRIDNTSYKQSFEDTPAVNVPIKFTVKDGQTVTLQPNKSVDLATLAKDADGDKVTMAVEDALNKYMQIEGTLSYQWFDEKGNPVGDPASVYVDENNRNAPEIPYCSVATTDGDIDKTLNYHLKVTFEPATVKESTTSKIPVTEHSEKGQVGITVEQKPGRIRFKKIIKNYDGSLKNDEFIINVSSISGTQISTGFVLKHDEISSYIEVMEPTKLQVQETVPMEYSFVGIMADDTHKSVEKALNSGFVEVSPGDDITVEIYNKYSWNPYFHAFDSITNVFSRK